ncbi:hypothetical protein PCASD_26103 [Puccinia coronata f. sp. avenae]|uniref:Uncharacterized protein n=1 Tax=Puccinia coronata f. sp. avenae TaxID=200324 RepID=A0A2N5SA80_9BASI|nr:hypothetical protein PCASD_26103 [Puccinia coronata f. sp. avenae]
MLVLRDPHARGGRQLRLVLERRDAALPSEGSSSQLNGIYIIVILAFMVVASLLLVAFLQYQSRRIDERLRAVMAAHGPRPAVPRPCKVTTTTTTATATATATITTSAPTQFIPSRPSLASFPSVSTASPSRPYAMSSVYSSHASLHTDNPDPSSTYYDDLTAALKDKSSLNSHFINPVNFCDQDFSSHLSLKTIRTIP